MGDATPTAARRLGPIFLARRNKSPARKGRFSEPGLGIVCITTTERNQVQKPNYQFEKRKREMEKKKKKDEKNQAKASSTETSPAAEVAPATEAAVIPDKA